MIYIPCASNISVEYKAAVHKFLKVLKLSLANACNFQLPYQNTMPAEGPKIWGILASPLGHIHALRNQKYKKSEDGNF